MFSSAELIEALRRRMRRSLRPQPPPGEFPPGWRDWFAMMSARPGHVTGARAEDVVAVVAARAPLPPSGIVEQLGRWRAFAALWRQDWQPASRDERWTRVASMSGSLLLHLLFVLALVWLMVFRLPFVASGEAAARDGEEHVLQVEYIGDGTPVDDAGGGAPEAPADVSEPRPADAVAMPAPAQPEPEPVADVAPDAAPPPADATPPPLPVREVTVEVPELPALVLPTPQELQVTEVEIPDSRHVVPPQRELEMTAPALQAKEIAVRSREVEIADPVDVVAPGVRAPRQVDVPVPAAPSHGVAVDERAVELREAPDVRLRPAAAAPPVAAPALRARAPAAPSRDVPMPAGRAAATAQGTAQAAATDARSGRADAPPSSSAGGRPDANDGARAPAASPGAGSQAGQPPGGSPARTVADDWGDSARNVPGRQAGTPGGSGLFDGDGRPRLADGGRVGGGLPPGTITEDFENIDRHGTWLKRPPYDYEPTSFDRFWMPSETLLEERVRKSVTEVRIPIPGTTKTIRCVTVMLALGGACDIMDPNLQEQPARARKPPDVPFKPELMEDQDALGSPPGS
ncbi:hypothetical protein GCM10007164_09180 [Luteimonas padinae]|uniref:Transmembrane repetitive protein n=1 Tax=Luteimonas padinae TaxID=1714359 RepID=A0ABV6SY81_9GAMM|nr:hypothetical protein [Luteimonas padinae]GHD68119.1 hypothetical protein GCM10007164_09180 [Luteimonas padinae]